MSDDVTPRRIRLSRKKDWRLPEGAVNVARPTRWGNPYVIDGDWVRHPDSEHFCAEGEARGVAVRLFREDLMGWRLGFDAADVSLFLRGKDLACWCPLDQPCHADVLLELANKAAL